MDPPWDVFICHRGPDVKKNFASFLHYALDVQGIRAFFDHAMVAGTNPRDGMKTAMQAAYWGVVVMSPGLFESKWCMEELRVFLDKGNVLPVSLGLSVDECNAARIAGKVGPVWEVHGGELWKKCEMEEAAWRSLVDRVAREAVLVKSEDSNDYWGELINELVVTLAKKLGRQVVESRVARSIVTLPYRRNQDFLGREEELAQIEEAFRKGQTSVSISSMGGMGKTQLALEYVYRHLEEYWKLLWVGAGAGSLLTNYLGLAEDLGVMLGKEKGAELIEDDRQSDREVALVKGALERLRVPCLLVFDDVTDADVSLLHRILPSTGNCRVIVTTRRTHLKNFVNLRLGQLSKPEGLRLIRGSPHTGNHEADLEALANRFGYLTLALSVCSAWMEESDKTPSELMRQLDSKGELVQAFKGRELDPAFKTNPDLLALFQASVEQLRGEQLGGLGEHVLWVGGWFASVSIRCELLSSAASGFNERGGKVEDIEDAIDLLVRLSLAGRGQVESGQVALRGVVFHSVVQSFGRVTGGDKSAVAMVRALVSVGNVALDTDHFQRACDLPIPPKANPRIQLDASDTEGAVNGILLPLVSHYQQKGLYFKARDAMTGANIDGMPDELQGRYLDRWASSLGDCGQYAEALPLYERALRIKEKALGPEHPEVATTLGGMAVLLRSQGKYEEALPLCERGLRIYEKALGPEHPSVATTLNNMANLLESQGKYAEALPLYERGLRIYEKALGPEHPEVATTLGGMAVLLESQGKYGEALPLCERSLRIKEKALGPEHPSVATTLGGMAVLLESQGNYGEALPLYERSLRISEKALGPEHPWVATTLNNMAGLLRSQGKYGEALPLYERALRIKEKALGPEHPSVATTLNNMAVLLESQGKYGEALPLYERDLRISEKALGPEHPSVATTLSNIAGLLWSQGKYEETLPLYERALRIKEKALGPEHPWVATTLNNMAGLLTSQGKYEEALPLYERSLRISEKALGPEHPQVISTRQKIAIETSNRRSQGRRCLLM